MMIMNQRSVNVDRLDLIVTLKQNLKLHRAEYAEALTEFHKQLSEDLRAAAERGAKTMDPESLKNFRFNVTFPQNHEVEYVEVIEMLEMSRDPFITLDSQPFKAYVKNALKDWRAAFENTKSQYAVGGSMAAF
jgi:hypothetical protein